MSIQIAEGIPTAKETSRKATGSEQELIATPFGQLTRDEIREWEKMLGCRLTKFPTQA